MRPVVEKILKLKEKHNALILAHYYEEGEIQDIADFTGDSLALAQVGQTRDNPVVLMAGVVFMAESVKILSPEKKILVPDLNAGCSLVDHSPFDKYLAWREKHPDGICISYVNSSAEVKAITDVTCTSTNAEKVVAAIPKDRPILFGPDRNLGSYLSKKLQRKMTLWPGACEVHVLFSARKLFELRREHPDAVVLAHPECIDAVLEYADVIGSTSKIISEVEHSKAKKFIIATESGIFHEIKKRRPEAELIQAPAEGSCACNECPYMKLNTLEKIANTLEKLSPEVSVDPKVMKLARVPLQRMMDINEGRSVEFPRRFVNPLPDHIVSPQAEL